MGLTEDFAAPVPSPRPPSWRDSLPLQRTTGRQKSINCNTCNTTSTN